MGGDVHGGVGGCGGKGLCGRGGIGVYVHRRVGRGCSGRVCGGV